MISTWITTNTDQETTHLTLAAVSTTLQGHTETTQHLHTQTHQVTAHHIMAVTKPTAIHHILEVQIIVNKYFNKILGNTTYGSQYPYNNDQYYNKRRNFGSMNDFLKGNLWIIMVLFFLVVLTKWNDFFMQGINFFNQFFIL